MCCDTREANRYPINQHEKTKRLYNLNITSEFRAILKNVRALN